MSISADDLTNSVSKLVELNQQIKESRSDIKVLSQAEKALKLHIKKLMIDNGLDVINTKTGKITVKKSVRKVGLIKDTIREGLSVFFEGNEEQAETALKVIVESLPIKETSTISVTGSKKKTSE
jgi:deoxyribose-phosphate aldolase